MNHAAEMTGEGRLISRQAAAGRSCTAGTCAGISGTHMEQGVWALIDPQAYATGMWV